MPFELIARLDFFSMKCQWRLFELEHYKSIVISALALEADYISAQNPDHLNLAGIQFYNFAIIQCTFPISGIIHLNIYFR